MAALFHSTHLAWRTPNDGPRLEQGLKKTLMQMECLFFQADEFLREPADICKNSNSLQSHGPHNLKDLVKKKPHCIIQMNNIKTKTSRAVINLGGALCDNTKISKTMF